MIADENEDAFSRKVFLKEERKGIERKATGEIQKTRELDGDS